MKASVLKKDKRIESRNDRQYGIQTFGDNNDFPQSVSEIVAASGTGKSCLFTYRKFVFGRGFRNTDLYKLIINSDGKTADYLLNETAGDLTKYAGFYVHVNYNMNFQAVEFYHQPYEHVRFTKLLENGTFAGYAVHPDWGRRFTDLKKFDKKDIIIIDKYNPDPEVIQEQVDAAGGWENYKGQLYFFGLDGQDSYPMPIYEPVLTDMNTEEGIANVSNRNARNNFLTAGALVDKVAGGEDESDAQETATEKAIKEFQGDEKACKIMYMQISSDDEAPEFISFSGKNYDKEFTVTKDNVVSDIGRMFNQPPILRAEDVQSGFGAENMRNAYDYYNSATEYERLILERCFAELFSNFFISAGVDFSIIPLEYKTKATLIERLGQNYDKAMQIVDGSKTPEQKRGLLKLLFGLDDSEINTLLS